MIFGNRFNFVTNVTVNLPKFSKNTKPYCQSQSFGKKKNLPRKRNLSISMEDIKFSKETMYGKISSILGLTVAFLTLGNIPLIPPMLKKQVQSATFSKKDLFQKLSQVPVFAIANATGQPYLTNNSKGDQLGLFFFEYSDAAALMMKMRSNNQVSDAQILTMTLDKAYKMATAPNTESSYRGAQGQDLQMIFKFYPNKKEVDFASSLTKKKNFLNSFTGCPAFVAEGLSITKGKEEIVPIFLTKRDLDAAWNKMCLSSPGLSSSKPKVEVYDLFQIIKEMQENNPEFINYGFFPPEFSVQVMNMERKKMSTPNATIPSGLIRKF